MDIITTSAVLVIIHAASPLSRVSSTARPAAAAFPGSASWGASTTSPGAWGICRSLRAKKGARRTWRSRRRRRGGGRGRARLRPMTFGARGASPGGTRGREENDEKQRRGPVRVIAAGNAAKGRASRNGRAVRSEGRSEPPRGGVYGTTERERQTWNEKNTSLFFGVLEYGYDIISTQNFTHQSHSARARRALATASNPIRSRYFSTDPCSRLILSSTPSITSRGAPRNRE